MGYSTTVAAAFSAMIVLVGVVAIVSTSVSSLETISETIERQVGLSINKLEEGCKIDSLLTLNSTTFRFNVTNSGQTSIRASDIGTIDVFVSGNSSGVLIKYLRFNQSGSSSEYWRINRVFFNNSPGDRVNPLDMESLVGAWDPLEVIEIYCKTSSIDFINYVTIVMPNGFKTSENSASVVKMGVAVIPEDSTRVIVNHHMGALPRNIQLTPMNLILSPFWVSNVNSNTFTVNIAEPQKGLSEFYWMTNP